MPAVDIGQICVKTRGNEKGKRCIIVDIVDRSYVLVTGPRSVTGVKRRRVNVGHLQILDESVNIPRQASDEDVAKALKTLPTK
jgi:large subunit ribosomal protein L14e